MTISVHIERAVSARNAGYRFTEFDDLSVLSVVGRRESQETSLSAVTAACSKPLKKALHSWRPMLPQHRLFLFVASPTELQQNAVSRKRGVWGGDGLKWLSPNALRSSSVELASEAGIRFVGLTEIQIPDLHLAADFMRTSSYAFGILSPLVALADDAVLALSACALTKDAHNLDWPGLVSRVEGSDEVLFRATGNFDDLEASIDLFLSRTVFERLEPSIPLQQGT